MFIRILITLVIVFSASVSAFETKDVVSVMKKYVSSITCNEDLNAPGFFKVLPISEIEYDPEYPRSYSGIDAYGVIWVGDQGCSGGSGSSGVYITPVVVNHWGTNLVVLHTKEITVPAREYIDATSNQKNNKLIINVKIYRDGDTNCCATGKEKLTYLYGDLNFKQIKK